MIFPAVGDFRGGRASELAVLANQGVLEQAAEFEVLEEPSDGFFNGQAVSGEFCAKPPRRSENWQLD
jgi:hypothetical protein